jgi:hypothetical protein
MKGRPQLRTDDRVPHSLSIRLRSTLKEDDAVPKSTQPNNAQTTLKDYEYVADTPQVSDVSPVRPVTEVLPLALAASPPVEPAGATFRGVVLPRAILPEVVDFPDADYLEFGWGDRDYYRGSHTSRTTRGQTCVRVWRLLPIVDPYGVA